MGSGLSSYEPNPALAWIYQRFFEHIEVDQAWAKQVREAESRGTVIYVLRNLSFVDFLALDYLTKKERLPRVRFANDLGLWVLEPAMSKRGLLGSILPRSEADDVRRLRQAIDEGASAALFLKRPPSVLEPPAMVRRRGGAARAIPTRGKTEGDTYLRAVLEAQRASSTPILLVPQVFVWTRSPDERKHNIVDSLFGPREWPGKIRTVTQFLMNWRHVTLRAGEPVDLQLFLEQEAKPDDDGKSPGDDVLVRRLTYTLLRRLERERQAVVGPTKKPADRLRDQVVRSPRLQKVIRDMAGEGETERRVLGWRALAMLRELETEVDPNALRAMDAAFDQTVSRMYSAFEIDEKGLERVRAASKDGTLVLLPSHKSHVDYIILTRLFMHANMPVPLVAAGDNLAFFPLGPILRRGGAFFIRRSFRGDRLYGAVVDAYMRRLIIDGWPLEFFLEGARSRTGKLLPPKLGLLSIVVDAVLGAAEQGGAGPARKVYFCPISIGYERVVEEREYVRELTGGEKKKEDVRGLVTAAETALGRYGRLNVQFGDLLTIDGVMAELGESKRAFTPARRRALVTRLAYRVMNEINRVTAITPSALVAAALLTHGRRGIPHADLVLACERLARILCGYQARFTPSLLVSEARAIESRSVDPAAAPQSSKPILRHGAIREACELFHRAGHVETHQPGVPVGERHERPRPGPEAVYVVPDVARLSLDISKNLMVHFFVTRATIATSLHAIAPEGITRALLAERVQALSRLFKYEFQFRADATFETIFTETLDAMLADGETETEPPGRADDDTALIRLARSGEGRERALLHVRMIQSFVEGYRVAARACTALLKGPLAPKDLAKRAITVGERMFLAGEIACREAVSRPVIDNALLAFVDQGYLGRSEGKYVLPESYANADAVRVIEGRIANYLAPI
ncbi:MAG: 1-acyl-sn-glycerol-3-phosphate acyltransferase [Myxococcales bacterium]|nr:1-acyl-sn-glycerol-3-phosphate acyltransferase [Myxococcales bacterium]